MLRPKKLFLLENDRSVTPSATILGFLTTRWICSPVRKFSEGTPSWKESEYRNEGAFPYPHWKGRLYEGPIEKFLCNFLRHGACLDKSP